MKDMRRWDMENIKEFIKPTGRLSLAPCPFCGGKEIIYCKYEHAVGERYMVVCMECMASIDPGWAQSMGAVQSLWNRRT